MKRLTLAVVLYLTLCPIYSSSRAQDEPLWKYITSTKNEQTGEEVSFHARDCYMFTDAKSEKYPKLAIKRSNSTVKESVVEYDCLRRAERTRIYTFLDGTEHKPTELDWEEVVPGSAGEALLDYACRDRSPRQDPAKLVADFEEAKVDLANLKPVTQKQLAYCSKLYLSRRDAEFLQRCAIPNRIRIYARQPNRVSGLIAIVGHPDINEEARILALQKNRHLTTPRK